MNGFQERIRKIERAMMAEQARLRSLTTRVGLIEEEADNDSQLPNSDETTCSIELPITITGCAMSGQIGAPQPGVLVTVYDSSGSIQDQETTDVLGTATLCVQTNAMTLTYATSQSDLGSVSITSTSPTTLSAVIAFGNAFNESPSVSFGGSIGAGATGIGVLSSGLVQSVMMISDGSAYSISSPPSVIFTQNDDPPRSNTRNVSGVAALSPVVGLTVVSSGSTGATGTFPLVFTSITPTPPTFSFTYVTVGTTRYLDSITVVTPGSGYGIAPTLTLSIVSGTGSITLQPQFSVVVEGGEVTSVDIMIPGWWASTLVVTISVTSSGKGGQDAAGTATFVSGTITATALTSGGYGYFSSPTISVSGVSGGPPSITATVDNTKIGGVTLLNAGVGFSCVGGMPDSSSMIAQLVTPWGTFDPVYFCTQGSIVVSTDGNGLNALPTPSSATSVIVSSISYGPGYLFTIWPILNVYNGSSSFGAWPTPINIICTFQQGVFLTPTVAGGGISSISFASTTTQDNGGYSDNPSYPTTVIISGDGTGAAAHAVISALGVITSIVVDSAGTGYTHATAVLAGQWNPGYKLNIVVSLALPTSSNAIQLTSTAATRGLTLGSNQRQSILAASTITEGPFSATFDFTGSVLDGPLFQGSTKTITLQGV